MEQRPRPSAARVEQVTTVTFAYWAINPRETKLLQQLARRFERANPGVHVELMGIPQRYYDKLQTLIAAGQPPDVFTANYGRLADLVRAGAVMDLSHFAAADPHLAGAFLPAAQRALTRLADVLGRPGLWGLPRDWSPAGLLIYNADILAAAGIEPPPATDPWSWRQFRQACEKIAASGREDVYATAVNLYPYSLFTWLRQGGVELFEADGHVTTDLRPLVETLRFLSGLWRDGLSPRPNPGHDDSFELFEAGRVAFVFGTFYNVQKCRDIDSFDWGVSVPLRGSAHACSCLPTFLAVSARASAPEIAWRWSRFLATAGAMDYARAALSAPAAAAALSPRVFLAAPPLDVARAPVIAAMRIAAPPPLHPVVAYDCIIDEMRTVLERGIARNDTPEILANELISRLRRLAGRHNAK